MGKGDIRSRRGKIWRGTTGVTRPRKKSKTPRPAAPSRKVKALKDLPKAVSEPIVKKPVVEAVQHHTAKAVPVIEHVQPEIAGVTAEVPQIVSEPVESAPAEAVSEKAKPKVKKAPAAKKAPAKAAAKKAPAKKAPAKKKK